MKNIMLYFILLFTCCLTQIATAQTVANVKGTKALLDMGSESWSVGDRVFAVDGAGKKKALMVIKQVKNGKAVADIIKGSAANGMSVAMGKSLSAPSMGGGMARMSKSGSAYGYSVAALMSTMKISNFVSNNTSYSFDMVGTNFGAGMFYDYPLSSSWFARGNGTIETFDVVKKMGSNICKNGTSPNCDASFIQAGFYGTFNYAFTGTPRFWLGAGGGAVIYLSKESTVLNTSKFFFNTVIIAAAGIDIFTSRTTFIPIALEYQTIPDKEAGVTSIAARIGWGKSF